METTPTPSPTPKLDAFIAMKEQIVAGPTFLPDNLLQICVEAMVETMPELDQKRAKLLVQCATIMQYLPHCPQRRAVFAEAKNYHKTLTEHSPESAAACLLGKLVINEQTAPH